MPEYQYAEPKDAAEASARIDHWMGNLADFQHKLGLHDPGNGHEPYHPQYSRHHTENGTMDVMAGYDMKLHPDRYTPKIEPVPPLTHSWQALLIRTRNDVVAAYRKWTDTEVLKKLARDQIKKLWDKIAVKKHAVLEKLGEPKPSIHRAPVRRSTPSDVINAFSMRPDAPPFDMDTYNKVQREIAEEAEAKNNPPRKYNDPGNDGPALFS